MTEIVKMTSGAIENSAWQSINFVKRFESDIVKDATARAINLPKSGLIWQLIATDWQRREYD
jgi:hypothetical protein